MSEIYLTTKIVEVPLASYIHEVLMYTLAAVHEYCVFTIILARLGQFFYLPLFCT
jgi:hypothetical protein